MLSSLRRRWNPFLRTLLYVHILVIAAYTSPTSVAVVSAIATFELLTRPASREKALALRAAIIYFLLALFFSVPARNPSLSSLVPPLRLYATMVASIVFFIASSPSDFIYMARALRLPAPVTFIIAALARYVPISFEAFREVLLAQSCRGLRLSIAASLRRTTYSALLIPLVASIARHANSLWISMHLRSIATLHPIVSRCRVVHGALLLMSALLWVLP